MSQPASPPIFVVEGFDIHVFATVEEAERWLEGPDVDDIRVIDAEGRLVPARAVGQSAELGSVGDPEPALRAELHGLVAGRLRAIGIDVDRSQWSDLVALAGAYAEQFNWAR